MPNLNAKEYSSFESISIFLKMVQNSGLHENFLMFLNTHNGAIFQR